jgi:ornithine cyclodeaminase/alanine dehydrogenase-like protein (mu-crystallin family)
MTDDRHFIALSTSDLSKVDIGHADVVAVVEEAYRALADGRSANPRKLTVSPDDDHSVAYAMLGRDGANDVVAIKTSYKFDPEQDRDRKHYYTTLSLYDDTTGLPIAMLDGGRIGALRTPAASALLARECAPPNPRTVLLIGTGTQGRQALPFLLVTLPGLENLLLCGSHPEGLAAVRDELRLHHPDRDVEIVDDLEEAAARADVVLAVAGAGTRAAVRNDWLRPGVLCVLVGHGLDPSTLHGADRVVATSAAQMAVTGIDMADPSGILRDVDAELTDILAGRARGRRDPAERVFAYNSGLVITDIALGRRFALEALAQGLGQEVGLWR